MSNWLVTCQRFDAKAAPPVLLYAVEIGPQVAKSRRGCWL